MKLFLILSVIIFSIIIEINAEFTNPIVPSGPDPWMQYYKGYYYLTATTFGTVIKMRKSKTIEGMRTAPETVIYTLVGTGSMWAPEFHLLNGKWYLYYTAGKDPKNYSTQRIHVIESSGDDPMGPYHFKADLIDPSDDHGMELDPSVITINGKLYLLGSYIHGGLQSLFIRAMSNPYTPSGKKILLSQPTLPWERQGSPVNEGPEPLHHGDKHMIVYSASNCDTPDYKLGLLTLTGSDPLNPSNWKKSGPVFQRLDSAHAFGPGHNGFFKSPNGQEDWIIYHANDSPQGKCGGGRSPRVQKFTWNPDGTPNFGVPVATGLKLQSPS
jgi:GH43 family beta-xylosidase